MSTLASSADTVLDKLVRAIRWSSGFTLLFIKCNHPTQRDQMRVALRERLLTEHVLDIVLDRPVVGLRDEIARAWNGARRPFAVSVIGLEVSINEDREASPVLGRLNHDRELLRQSVPGPLLLWLPDFALDCLVRGAPDFWAWRSGVYEFETDRVLWSEQSRDVWSADADASASLSLSDKRKEVARLGDLLRAARSLPERDSRSQKTIAQMLIRLATLYSSLGDARQAVATLEEALEIRRRIEDRGAEGDALRRLGNAYLDLGDARRAAGFHEQALAIARDLGDRRTEGNALGSLGNAYANLGDVRRAIACYEQALMIAREIGDRRGEGNALGNLGNAHANLDDASRAVGFYEQALAIAREIGDRRGEGNALGNLGNACADLGDASRAVELYEQRLVIAREIGDRVGEASGRFNLALLYAQQGEREPAREHAQAALQYFETVGKPELAARAQSLLKELQA